MPGYRVKPSAPVLNRSHPLARGLVWAAMPGTQRELVAGGQGTLIGTSTWTGGSPYGKALTTDDSLNDGAYWPWSANLATITTQCTIVVLANISAMSAWGTLWGVPYRSSGWTSPYFALGFARYDNTSQLKVHYATPSNSDARSSAGAIQITDGPTLYGVTKNDTAHRFFRNGQYHSAGTGTFSGSIDWSNTRPPVVLNRSTTSLGEGMTGACDLVLVWNRVLSDIEMQWIGVDPFVIARPVPAHWVVAPAGGGYSLAADAGSYTVTGQTTTLTAARKLTLDAGSYSVTGQDASPLIARLMDAAAGNYTVTGQDAALAATRLLAFDAGSYTITGQDATFGRGYGLSVDAGSYTVTGNDASLLTTRLLAAAAGTYALTGQDAELTAARLLALDAGSYTVTGQTAALLVARALGVDAGAYTVTGRDATLFYQPNSGAYQLVADTGSYTISGQDVGLLVSRALTADAGAYVVTGNAAQVLYGHFLEAAAGNYTVTGNDATMALARVLSLATGSYNVTGQTVTLAYTGTATPISADRIYVIAAEDRIYVIPAESRTFAVDDENRTYIIQ